MVISSSVTRSNALKTAEVQIGSRGFIRLCEISVGINSV